MEVKCLIKFSEESNFCDSTRTWEWTKERGAEVVRERDQSPEKRIGRRIEETGLNLVRRGDDLRRGTDLNPRREPRGGGPNRVKGGEADLGHPRGVRT